MTERLAEGADEERKLVTVLFADVVGSTLLGEQLDPERLRSVLSAWFSAAAGTIEAWGGTVEKFIGDAIVAVFGVPAVREDDAVRALHAALDMLDRVPDLNRRFQEQHGVSLEIRIGVNSGDVIAPRAPATQGAAGTLVAGDAVNVAARLQQSAEPGTVMVGERSYLAGRDAFDFGQPVALELKGKSGAVPARRLLSARAEARRGIPGLRASMIGRDRELATLTAALDETVATGRPNLILVYGPAGIGKSRLLQEFVRACNGREPAVSVLRGRCLAAGQTMSYWALADMLRSSAGISLDEPAESAQAKLRRRVEGVLAGGAGGATEVESTVHALALTSGISIPGNPLHALEPKAVADELSRAWPRFTSALAAAGPTVLVIEDLHWASEELVEMLERVLARSSGPLLLVATARPEFAQDHSSLAAGRDDVASISLRVLSAEQSNQLLDELLATADVPGRLRAEIVAAVEGNPFFLEEVLRRLIDEGGLIRRDNRWQATDRASKVALPDSVLGLLAARIDSLPRHEKRVLQEAAVVGRIFWAEPVERLLGKGSVGEALLQLETRGLVVVRPTSSIQGQSEFIFKHALVRDVAYAGLPRRRRAKAHADVAAWIEDLAADRTEEFQDLLAYHYGEAALGQDADLAWQDDAAGASRVRARAYQAMLAAGDSARRRYALNAAVERHNQAKALASTDAELARALEALGDDHEAAYHGEEVWTALEQALAMARAAGDRKAAARLILKMARVSTKIGTFRTPPDPQVVEELLAEGIAFAADEDAVRAQLLIQRGASTRDMWMLLRERDQIDPETRRGWIEEGRAIASELRDPNLEWEALDGLATWHWNQRDPQGVLHWIEKAVAVLPNVESASTRALGYYSASHYLRGLTADYARALDLGRRSHELARSLSPHELMHGTLLMMLPLYRLGRWAEIEPLLDEHRAAWAEEADRSCGSVRGGLALGALLRAHQGRSVEARQLLDLVDRPTKYASIGDILAIEALVWLGDLDQARENLRVPVRMYLAAGPLVRSVALDVHLAAGDWAGVEEALGLARDDLAWERMLGPAADRAEGLLRAERGDEAGGRASLERAIAGYEDLHVPYDAARTKELLAGLTAEPERRRLLRQAREAYGRLGAILDADRVRGLLGSPPMAEPASVPRPRAGR